MANQSTLNRAQVIEITKACIVAFMKGRNSWVVWCREKEKKQKMVKMNFKALAKIFFVNIKKLLMADLLSNGLHEKVLICYIIMSQPAFTCSKLTTEALEQGVKYVQS